MVRPSAGGRACRPAPWTPAAVLPRVAGVEGAESARQIRIAGAVHAAYSTATDYPLGRRKVIPDKVHLGLDAVGPLALAATPFITGQWRKGTRHWVVHLALGVFELSSLVLTDPTGRGDLHGDIEAVRQANSGDPQRKIRDRRPAVTPAVVG